jgi:SAM-dependent methyltransferase
MAGFFGYEKMQEIIVSLSPSPEPTDILEIGCYSGMFVGVLRDMGYNAYGIDINPRVLRTEGLEQGYLRCQDATTLTEYEDRLYDIIFTNRVLSSNATFGQLMQDHSALISDFMHRKPEYLERLSKGADLISKQRNMRILETIYHKIKPGKFFVGVESDEETFCFGEREAENIGYKVLYYTPSQCILQKL